MDKELMAKLMLACIQNNVPMGTHKQQKEPIKVLFSDSWVDTAEFDDICREINVLPGEFVKKINRPTGLPGLTSPLYMSKDTNPEHFLFTVHKLKRNTGAINDCLTDLLETWIKDRSGKLKNHHKLTEKMKRGYLKLRDAEHPDEDRKLSHQDIKTSIENYQLWAMASKNNEGVWFQKWDLDGFLRSNKAVSEWCYDKKNMMEKVGEQYFEIKEAEPNEDPEEAKQRKLSFLKDIKANIDKGREPEGEFLEFWNEHKHLLEELDD